MALGGIDHPVWIAAAGTLGSYAVVLLVLFVLLFAVPYLLSSFSL